MKVTVNLPNLPEGEMIEVMHAFNVATPAEEGFKTIQVTLGSFANGSTNDVDDSVVTAVGALPVNVIVGEPVSTPLPQTSTFPPATNTTTSPLTTDSPSTDTEQGV